MSKELRHIHRTTHRVRESRHAIAIMHWVDDVSSVVGMLEECGMTHLALLHTCDRHMIVM